MVHPQDYHTRSHTVGKLNEFVINGYIVSTSGVEPDAVEVPLVLMWGGFLGLP